MGFFRKCAEDPDAANLLYVEFPAYYSWQNNEWIRRKRTRQFTPLGRLNSRVPGTSEWHLRLLLNHIRGPTSFLDIRTIDGHECQTYKEACLLLGLLESDEQWHKTMEDAAPLGLFQTV